MLSLNQKSLILLIVLLIITPSQANISDSKSYQAKGVSTTINTGINGGDLADNLLKAYTTALIDIGAKKGANWIGDRYALNSYTGGIGSKNYWIHKGLHAGLGCATASAKGQDCASGAMGGAIGEIIGEGLLKNGVRDKETLLALSRIGTAFAAQAGGYDVNTADGTASNAIINNLLTAVYDKSDGILTITDDDTGETVTVPAKAGTSGKGPPPNGKYEILEQAKDSNSYRYDGIDDNPRDDEYKGRTNLRIHHNGRGYTSGCISVSECNPNARTGPNWNAVNRIIENTRTDIVKDNFNPWYRSFIGIPPKGEYIKKYGILEVQE